VGAIVSGRGITPAASPSILGGGADGVGGGVAWRAGCLVRGEQASRGRDVLGCWHSGTPHLAPGGVGDRREASSVGGLEASAVGGTLEA
jgi:hypothetical protein